MKQLLRQWPILSKNTDTGTKHEVTKKTRGTQNKAQNMPIQAQRMPIQAQNMPNQAQNTILDTTKNSRKIHTQANYLNFGQARKTDRCTRLIDVPLTWAFQNEMVYGKKHKKFPWRMT